MKGHAHARRRRTPGIALAASLVAASLAGSAPSLATDPSDLPGCTDFEPASASIGSIVSPWQATVDSDGVVIGHRLTLRRDGIDTTLRTGRRGFALRLADGRLLVGERSGASTRFSMIDPGQGCRSWTRSIDALAYASSGSGAGDAGLRLTMHDPGTRSYLGTLQLDAETGDTEAMIDGECATNCDPNDGEVPMAAFGPAAAARPVPNFAGGAWPGDKLLSFRWASGSEPPSWAKGPLKAAADDAVRTSVSLSPRFVYKSGAENSVRYAGPIPTFCGGIACASRAMPTWGVWLRAHGSDFAWGTLRWCQKSLTAGCFDIRRVMLHELGHIAGLNHPESSGFRLSAHESVMHAISPAKPQPGSTRHAFGRCDVATLQELYGLVNNRTSVSDCNDVDSRLSLAANKGSVVPGSSVKLTAVLSIADRSAYRRLAGRPLNGRSVKLKYRRAGSTDAWATAWMKSQFSSGRYELTISPSRTWEFKATFPAPAAEGLNYSRSEIVKVSVRP